MLDATRTAFDAQIEFDEEADIEVRRTRDAAADIRLRLAVHEDMAAVEQVWREFEQVAAGTVFQSFDWLSTWQQHIGLLNGVTPAIIIGRNTQRQLEFLLPLAIARRGLARQLTWLGSALCDYNGPLLADDFAKRVDATQFRQTWSDILQVLQSHPRLRFDAVCLDKMQNMVGTQPNPFMALGVIPHPDGAYRTCLEGDWAAFYAKKRSSSTRQRDRAKRKRLAERGEVRFVSPEAAADLATTLDTLVTQKVRSIAAMGAANIFARPGHMAFYRALAAKRDFAHVSRLDVGSQTAAANLGLVFRGSYYHLLASHTDGELSRFGPGAAHLHELMRHAIERGCRVFDFTIGDERYKREWCDTAITLFDHVSPATLRGVPLALRSYATRRIKRWIKQTPALWDAAYRLRALIGKVMPRPRG